MKPTVRFLTVIFILILVLSGCGKGIPTDTVLPWNGGGGANTTPGAPGESADLGGDDTVFGENLDDLGVYDGLFEEDADSVVITCISGTQNCYTLEGNVLTFTAISEDTVYSVSGRLKGNIVIDVGDAYKFDLEMHGFSLVSDSINPITVLSGDEVSLTAKKDYSNYIYDQREAIDDTDETLYKGAIYSMVDLEICGKGSLTVVSENNNGIHSKDDLQVKNLTLFVACIDNALKGNDSVEITGGNLTLIASAGDGIKTTNSDVSSKGNQRGSVTIAGGTHTIYAACDGIDAAYDVVIEDDTTVLNIYTDKYSAYSDEVTAVSSSEYYIRYTSKNYSYSVKYYNSDEDYVWVNADYHSAVSGGRTNYYYYSFPKMTEYSKMRFFIYSSGMEQQQEDVYAAASDYMELNMSYDTIAVSGSGYSWTNYTTSIQSGGFGGGMGGMNSGNTDKGDHSTKGIKAFNEIVINAGTVNIKSYDDAIHANNDQELENGTSPLGNVTINGGNITVYSNDDGIHADGELTVKSGTVSVTNSYEGLEGSCISIEGGFISVLASDDGINGTTSSGTAITISGGTLYVCCNGDGLDSNSRTSYSGIVFSGGRTVIISTSSGNSAIDTEQGYKYTGGYVVAIMPRGGMSSESTNCQNFSGIGSYSSLSLTKGNYIVVGIGAEKVTILIPCSLSAYVIVLGDTSPSVVSETSVSVELDSNGIIWN